MKKMLKVFKMSYQRHIEGQSEFYKKLIQSTENIMMHHKVVSEELLLTILKGHQQKLGKEEIFQ